MYSVLDGLRQKTIENLRRKYERYPHYAFIICASMSVRWVDSAENVGAGKAPFKPAEKV
jgi:hypothetical protein